MIKTVTLEFTIYTECVNTLFCAGVQISSLGLSLLRHTYFLVYMVLWSDYIHVFVLYYAPTNPKCDLVFIMFRYS